jgi:hypothetical protein
VNTTLKQHILSKHSSIDEKKKEFKYYCEKCDFGAFAKKLYDQHCKTIKHKQKNNDNTMNLLAIKDCCYQDEIYELDQLIKNSEYDEAITMLYYMDTMACEKSMIEIEKDKELFNKLFPNAKCKDYLRIIVHNRYKEQIKFLGSYS